jgi:cell division protein FtsQ
MTMNEAELPLDIRLMHQATRALVAVFVVLAATAAGWWLVRHPVWMVRGLLVEGDVAHQSAVTLRAQLAPQMRTVLAPGVLALDLQRVRELFESVPWVRRAVVRREFPNRLRVTLEEHEAVAWWGPSGSNRLLSRLGEVFEATPDDGEGLPELQGPDDQAQLVWQTYLQLQEAFAEVRMGVQGLELTERGSWRAELDNGARIELGRGSTEELLARVRRFTATFGQLTQHYPGAVESVDLRYPNGYALRVRGA